MFEEFDLQALRRVPQFAHYFRYPLRHQDFHEVREHGRLSISEESTPVISTPSAWSKDFNPASRSEQSVTINK